MMKGATEHGHASTFVKLAQNSMAYGAPSSPYLEPVIQEFSGAGYNVQVLLVEDEFQRGSDRMLKISKQLLKNH
jgi:hypothetical protein